jgi:hypothetical protein
MLDALPLHMRATVHGNVYVHVGPRVDGNKRCHKKRQRRAANRHSNAGTWHDVKALRRAAVARYNAQERPNRAAVAQMHGPKGYALG